MNEEHFNFLIKGGEDHNENWTVHEVLKATVILSTYHGICGLCFGMGLVPDLDIVQELLTLMGPEALELTISKEQIRTNSNQKINSYHAPLLSGNEGDQSSCASRSQRSHSDEQSKKILQYLKKKEKKRAQRKQSNRAYLSDSDESDKDDGRKSSGSDNSQEEFKNDFKSVG